MIYKSFYLLFQEDDHDVYFKAIMKEIQSSTVIKTVGVFSDEKYFSPLMKEWQITLQKSDFKKVSH